MGKELDACKIEQSLFYHKLEQPLYVEEIVVKVPPDRVDDWIRLDTEIWGPILATRSIFKGKEIWVSKTNPGEITAIIYWSDYELLKTEDPDWVAEIDQKMKEAMGGAIESMVFRDATDLRVKVGEYRENNES